MSSDQPESVERREITIRRAPRFVPFLIVGGLLGIAAAFIITYAAPENRDFTRESVLGYFAVLMAVPGVGLGALVALLLDFLSVRRRQRGFLEQLEDEKHGPLPS